MNHEVVHTRRCHAMRQAESRKSAVPSAAIPMALMPADLDVRQCTHLSQARRQLNRCLKHAPAFICRSAPSKSFGLVVVAEADMHDVQVQPADVAIRCGWRRWSRARKTDVAAIRGFRSERPQHLSVGMHVFKPSAHSPVHSPVRILAVRILQEFPTLVALGTRHDHVSHNPLQGAPCRPEPHHVPGQDLHGSEVRVPDTRQPSTVVGVPLVGPAAIREL